MRNARPVAGGCISSARIVELEDGRSFFVKSNRRELAPMFEGEAEGLSFLASVDTLRVPKGAVTGVVGEIAWIAMEALESAPARPRFWEELGEGFARLHAEGRADRFGFPHDNYIGATPQPNEWMDDWTEFWRRRRIGHQLAIAREGGRSDPELDRLGDRLLERLEAFLGGVDEPPSLLHGDLWSGNVMTGPGGEPVLIDPACSYGHREADLAMTRLFGGFDQRFYDAYEAAWPLSPGHRERLPLYELYHLLNHLNLFGGSYRGQCLAVLRRLAG
ncbi:MAG: fructosamine kinase family protein [Thermoanaerobaculia bacterium]